MPRLYTQDGVELFYRDWGAGRAVLFLHSLLMTSTMWQNQLLHLAERGYRAIAYDRRGHGRSDDPGGGYDYDTLADDLAAVIETLQLTDVTLIGHSMGGGELVRYMSRHGQRRVRQIALVGSTVPRLEIDPDAVTGLLDQLRVNYGQWIAENASASFGRKPPGLAIPRLHKEQVVRDWMSVSLKAAIECQATTFATDFEPELPAVSVPALVVHGDDDAVAPLETCGARAAELLPHATLVVYPDASHMIQLTHGQRLTDDILHFLADR